MNVYELYSGIGGMHFALKESGIDAKILRAIDINTSANAVYKLNFPKTNLLERNIQNLSAKDFDGIDLILMSPPCQPHTRNGLKKDKSDERSTSLLHIISLLPHLKTVRYILLENVKGFETSETRDELVKVLSKSNFIYQEFLLTPRQFSIPNSRLRYYLLAKKTSFCFDVENGIMEKLPNLRNDVELSILKIREKYLGKTSAEDSCYSIKLILDEDINPVPDKILIKYGKILDIVTGESTKSCCFTKGYTHFVEGTGSVFSPKSQNEIRRVFENVDTLNDSSHEYLELLKSLELRYFSPLEISRLMSFPDSLQFPNYLSKKQMYRLLGNSINVHVVAILIRILVS